MDLKDKEKNAVSLQNKGDEEYIKEGTWKDGAFYTVMSQFVRNPTALLGFAVMLVIVVACVAAPLLCNFSPYEVNPIEQYQTPNAVHWFGTDSMGRDMFARILYGGRNSLALGIGSSIIGAVLGIILGTIAGDDTIMLVVHEAASHDEVRSFLSQIIPNIK